VKEFQVNSNSFSAEYGCDGGAVINVVTKSGTNDPRVGLRVLMQGVEREQRDQRAQQPPKSPYHYNQFGGTVGGPSGATGLISPTTTGSGTHSRTSSS
jgi:hypothetical protein